MLYHRTNKAVATLAPFALPSQADVDFTDEVDAGDDGAAGAATAGAADDSSERPSTASVTEPAGESLLEPSLAVSSRLPDYVFALGRCDAQALPCGKRGGKAEPRKSPAAASSRLPKYVFALGRCDEQAPPCGKRSGKQVCVVS